MGLLAGPAAAVEAEVAALLLATSLALTAEMTPGVP